MLLHVVFGQFDAHRETLHHEDDPAELQGDLVRIAPCPRVDEVCRVGTENDAANGGHRGFTNVESLLDEGRAEHEKRGEATQDDVDQMWPVDCQVLPGHVGRRVW